MPGDVWQPGGDPIVRELGPDELETTSTVPTSMTTSASWVPVERHMLYAPTSMHEDERDTSMHEDESAIHNANGCVDHPGSIHIAR